MTDSPGADQSPPPSPPSPVDHLPSAPSLSVHEAALPPRPVEVTASFWAWIVGALSPLLLPVALISERDETVRVALESDSTLEGPQVAVAVMLAIAFSAVLAVVVAALCLLFAFKVRAGRNWARITLTVLTVFGVSFTAVDPSWPSLVSTLVAVVATVLMFLPNANAYFRGQRRPGG